MHVTNDLSVLKGKFDIELHKKTFYRYLEVIIDPEGVVHYAVPSHNERTIKYIMDTLGFDRQQIEDMVKMLWVDCGGMVEALCEISKCISVWNNFYIGKANDKQRETLQKLQDNGLYEGAIYNE
jgi:hypothetical protein